MDQLFAVHKLNDTGMVRAGLIAASFTELLKDLKQHCPEGTRTFALVRTHLEAACFYAKKAMAELPDNQAEPADKDNHGGTVAFAVPPDTSNA